VAVVNSANPEPASGQPVGVEKLVVITRETVFQQEKYE
jgi:hypothetical protein